MNHPLLIGIAVVLAGLTTYAGAEQEQANRRTAIERDLKLQFDRANNQRTLRPGKRIGFKLKLTNESEEATYPIVKPGDGSGIGWREPHVFWEAQQKDADGKWQAVESHGILRCGLFDPNWQKDVVSLEPGESLALKDWLASPELSLYFEQPGEIRIRAVYDYARGERKRQPKDQPIDRGAMGDTPAFRIHSNWVAYTVVCPLEVSVEPIGKLVIGEKLAISKVVKVRVKNISDKPIELPRLIEEYLSLRVTTNPGWSPILSNHRAAGKVTLKPGESVMLIGTDGDLPALGFDGQWETATATTHTVKAMLWIDGARYTSKAVEIPTIKPGNK
jgi:hypothetical protein